MDGWKNLALDRKYIRNVNGEHDKRINILYVCVYIYKL
jgi:hypothetical protein